MDALTRKSEITNGNQEQRGMKMNGIENIIVGLWFLPVTIFIIIPLAMLIAWLSFKAVRPLVVSRSRVSEESPEQSVDSAAYSKA